MKKVFLEEVRHLIPEDCLYKNEEPRSPLLFYDGDQHWESPVDLDEIYAEYQTEDFMPFVLVNGNLQAPQIFNEETDGSTGLIVLGNLTAQNMVVGGQEIYVGGDLNVTGLYWGDYNHGGLIAKGSITARVFLNSDYGVDFDRFRNNERIQIEHRFWDEVDQDYDEVEKLKMVFKPELILDESELDEDDIYSWKDWLSTSGLFDCLRNNAPVLLDENEAMRMLDIDREPSFFTDEAISEANLVRFSDGHLLVGPNAVVGRECIFEYWQDDVFKRVTTFFGQPKSTAVYLQYDEEYACMVYFGTDPSAVISSEQDYTLSISYRNLHEREEKWIPLNEDTPPKYVDFLRTQWKKILEEYSELLELDLAYKTSVTPERFRAIMDLPLVKKVGTKYYKDSSNSCIYFRGLQWQFRNENLRKDDTARISILKHRGRDEDGDDLFDFYHYELEKDKSGNEYIDMFTQEDDDFDADLFDIELTDISKFRNAVNFFIQLDRHIPKVKQT